MKILQYIFRSRLAFEPVDPLGDGLREMIERERSEAESIRLHDEYDTRFWDDMDIHS